ncbi:4Fe-4S dicluster domain-containing protein [Nocardioides marmoribigeumensis]|uniref:Fe-S oxidoreductase n=1 Tax=Nocardioides marmoribigeumensis TaxID=433649 RepID=A0ABU2BVF3_9ACTN|nr:4Fe-4S dicluster domain-containing protein [Nocardioides marmoribigeumensis]MDR7362605.1 Fe-S oxidoreductase [Nocardioides marmoribigeumensis]
MTWVLVLGLLLNAVALPLAARRVVFLYRLISSGQPAPDRLENVTKRTGKAIGSQLTEVLGQRRLLKWSIPGAAHAFVMYAFLILASVYLEAYMALLLQDPSAGFLVFNAWGPLGFLQDLIGVLCLVGLAIFTVIRVKEAPARLGRKSRFKGSHTGGAWLVLFMIFNVIWTMFLFRGASSALGNLNYGKWAFASYAVGKALGGPTDSHAVEVLEGIGLLLHIGVMLVFLIIVLNSKHLHIFIAPLNVMFKRPDGPLALGALKPLMSDGKALTLDDVEDMDEDTKLGIGAIEDFTWKGLLDMASCTECGRCQSQCPAWNTEKPLSPKMLIMGLRDHAFAKAPYLLADEEGRTGLEPQVMAEVERPLVGETEGEAWHPTGGAVIDTDVLWSCVTCGACVNQCPVDIEHVDHIVDMRRYQVLIESSFPSELNGLFKGLESKGNPWNMSPNMRLDWAQGMDVKVVGEDVEDLDEVDWLFWIGCAGAYEDRAKKTVRAVAELLDLADVSFAVLGKGETCTGDSARRAGNEFLFQQLATQNVEVLTEAKAKKVVSTCPHCFNTLKNEYKELGIELEVVHHTQLLNRLVREGRLTPVADHAGPKQKVTYHDPCYLGRHNQVYTPPRELLEVIPSTEFTEMERSGERSFCCGAGGARMWMEERIGERINENRTREAVETGADQIAVGCPFCRVMLSDGLTNMQSKEEAREEVEVLDVAQMLLAAVKRGETPAEATAEPGEGDDERYPATAAHDGTDDPEQAPDRKGDAPEVTDPTGPLGEPEVEVADSGETASAASAASASLPAWAGLDVETILEGDDVDISEFKAKLKAELKDELLAEIKAELEGALNSDSGTSEPVEKTTSPSIADAPKAEEKPAAVEEKAPEPEPEPEPEPAAAEKAEPEAKPTTEEEKVEEKKPASSSEPPPDIDFSGSL